MCVLRGSFSASMLNFRSVALSLSLSLCVFSVAYACTFVDCRAGCQTDTLWHVGKIMQHLKTFERWPKLPIKKEVGKGLMILSLNLYIVLVWYYVHVYNGNSYAFDFFLWNSHRATAPVSRSMIFYMPLGSCVISYHWLLWSMRPVALRKRWREGFRGKSSCWRLVEDAWRCPIDQGTERIGNQVQSKCGILNFCLFLALCVGCWRVVCIPRGFGDHSLLDWCSVDLQSWPW